MDSDVSVNTTERAGKDTPVYPPITSPFSSFSSSLYNNERAGATTLHDFSDAFFCTIQEEPVLMTPPSSGELEYVASPQTEGQGSLFLWEWSRDRGSVEAAVDSNSTSSISEPSMSPSTSSSFSTNDVQDKNSDVDSSGKVRKRWANALPPCKVCTQPASGFHYGVNTCEACKVFFKRCLNRKRPPRCKGRNNNCNVQGVKRVVCAYCRYQWCLALGMSRDSIKLGRYTCIRRNENYKDLQKHSALNPDYITPAEVTELADILLEAHKDVFTNWNISDEEMLQKAKQVTERKELEQDLFGNNCLVSIEEYQRFYNETGLELDYRGSFLRLYARCMELQIHGFVQFSKGIPRFRTLPLEDQAKLLKYAHFELMMLGTYRGHIHDYNVYVNPSGNCIHIKDCIAILGAEREELEDQLSKKLRCLDVLTRGELVLLKAICLTFSDRCELKAKDTVEDIQWKLMCVLQKSLQINHTHKDIQLSNVIDCLTELRKVSDVTDRSHSGNELIASAFKNHPILAEFMVP